MKTLPAAFSRLGRSLPFVSAPLFESSAKVGGSSGALASGGRFVEDNRRLAGKMPALPALLQGTLSGSFGRVSFLGLCLLGLSSTFSRGAIVFDVTEISPNLNSVSAPFYAINNRGEAVGGHQISTGGTHSLLMIYMPQAAYGLPAGLNEIDPPVPVGDRAYSIRPYGINEHGRIVGTWRLQSATLQDRGFIWDQGQFTDLGSLVSCLAVNNDGWIAGSEFFTNLANGYPTVRAGGPPVLITNTPFGPPHNYINLESVVPGAVAINDSGQVLLHVRYNYRATSSDPELSDFAIFIWQDGTNQTVPGIGGPPAINGGSQTFASDLNNRGEAVGRDASGVWLYLPQAAYGLSSGIHILDPEFSAGQKINDLGTALLDNNSSLFWQTGQVHDAQNKLPADSSWIVHGLTDLNNPGQILARARFGTDSTSRNVILSPRFVETITVNDATDAPDADPNDGVLDVDLNQPDLQVSLRAAINFANSTNRPGPDTIDFNIAGANPVILPTNALPDILESLIIDGSSQLGGLVTLAGNIAGAVDGFRIRTTESIIKAMVIQKFQGAGIDIDGGGGHRIIGSVIGTDAGGGTGFGNGTGVRINNSFSNIVGGLTEKLRNVISGNNAAGIALSNCTDIQIRANLVGTDPTGEISLPNGQFGLIASKITSLTIGAASVLSVFSSPTAISLSNISGGEGGGEGSGGSLINSHIGLGGGGSGTLSGTGNGVVLEDSSDFDIGGAVRNVFAGIAARAISIINSTNIKVSANYIGTDRTGNVSLPVGTGIFADKVKQFFIGVSNALTVINGQTAVQLNGAGGGGGDSGSGGGDAAINTRIINCNVGLNASGNAALGGTSQGVLIHGGSGVGMGGPGNARNYFAGIVSNAVSVIGATNVQILANFFGTSRSGSANLPVGTGIAAHVAHDLVIGATNQVSVFNANVAADLNQVTGSGGDSGSGGGSGGSSTGGSRMDNCYVGINAAGSAALGGTTNGVIVRNSRAFTLGKFAGNVFAGMRSNAVTILNCTNINVAANYIGTTSTGNASLGGTAGGIFADAVHDLLIGDTNRLSVINAQTAVRLNGITGGGSNSGGSRIDNCHIGLRASGTAVLGGTTNGLHIARSAGLIVGGLVRNVMAGIPSNAVTVLDSTNIHLAGNYIGTASNGTTSLPVGTGFAVEFARQFRIGASNALTVVNARTAGELKNISSPGGAGAFAGRMFNTYVGLSANGTNSLNGTTNGITLSDSEGFEIGAVESAYRNVFGGIASNSLRLLRVTNVAVSANHFGTDRLGVRALANRSAHVFLDQVRNVIIGTTNAISTICGAGADGIAIRDSHDVTIQNASVGLLLGGTQTGSGNGSNGISSVNSRGVSIGGTHPTQRVLVSRNGRHGIEAMDTAALKVEGCIIGSGTNRTEAHGNSLSGVRVYGSLAGQVFAESAATLLKRNSILFNQKSGIELSQEAPLTQPQAPVHIIQSNELKSNVEDGIRVNEGVGSVSMGGTNSGQGNTISQNGGGGVRINNPGARVFVEANSIFGNTLKALVREMDAQTQIQQQITSATKGSTLVQGTVSGRPNQTLRMHFYAHRPKAGAQGEGEMWLGSLDVPLNGSGGGSYDQRLPRTAPTGWLVASTAADPEYGTAEFSDSQVVQLPTDTDGDGLPDFWEALYPSCLNPAIPDPPNEDCDKDGFTNPQEYIAHTDPTQANSALKVDDLETSGDGATLNFTGVAGRQYGLERRPELTSGAWVRVATVISDADGKVSLTDPNPPPGHSFYRLVAEIP